MMPIKQLVSIVWEHATQLRTEESATVSWYTSKHGFNTNDEFKLISLELICKKNHKNYPLKTLIMRVDIQETTLFIISFPERSSGFGFSSIVYKPDCVNAFLDTNLDNVHTNTLFKILVEIVTLECIDYDYVDSQNGTMATFKHKLRKENNWVKNRINKGS